MKDEKIDKFSWTALFLVTGFSFFIFSKILQFLNGSQLPVFTWIGITAILMGTLISIHTLLEKAEK